MIKKLRKAPGLVLSGAMLLSAMGLTGCGAAAPAATPATAETAVPTELSAPAVTETPKPAETPAATETPEPAASAEAPAEAAPLFLTPRERLGLEAPDSPEWVQALPEAAEAEQLFVVAGHEKTTAWVSMHQRDENGNWKMIMTTPGFIGLNGLGKEREGDGRTPTGVYTFNRAFGLAEDPGCAIPYVQAGEDLYWSGDVRDGMRYNELVSLNDYPDLNLDDSEHIADYPYEYRYCLNISYNAACTPGLGSAIFLHCLGDHKPRTGGCVAIPEEQMYYVMRHVSPDCVVVIDTLDNLGGKL